MWCVIDREARYWECRGPHLPIPVVADTPPLPQLQPLEIEVREAESISTPSPPTLLEGLTVTIQKGLRGLFGSAQGYKLIKQD